jgi:predicted nuclease of predicted toxin-antitoxin system
VLSGQWKRIEIAEAERAAWKRALGQTARFLVDEDIDPELARALSNLGYSSTSVKAAGLAGRPDEDVLAFAKREDRILVTNDRGFANERRFPEHRNPGVVIVPAGFA